MYTCSEDVPQTVWTAELTDELRVAITVPAGDMSVEQARELRDALDQITRDGEHEIQTGLAEIAATAATEGLATIRRLERLHADGKPSAGGLLAEWGQHDGRIGLAARSATAPYLGAYRTAHRADQETGR